jgi:hypothetical protein
MSPQGMHINYVFFFLFCLPVDVAAPDVWLVYTCSDDMQIATMPMVFPVSLGLFDVLLFCLVAKVRSCTRHS